MGNIFDPLGLGQDYGTAIAKAFSGGPSGIQGYQDPWAPTAERPHGIPMPALPDPNNDSWARLAKILGVDPQSKQDAANAQGGLFAGNPMAPADHTHEAHYNDAAGINPQAAPAPQPFHMKTPSGPALQGEFAGGWGSGPLGSSWATSTNGGSLWNRAPAQAPGKMPGWQPQGNGIWKQG